MGGGLLSTKCVFWYSLQLLFEEFVIPKVSERDMIKNVRWFYVKCPLFSSNFNKT